MQRFYHRRRPASTSRRTCAGSAVTACAGGPGRGYIRGVIRRLLFALLLLCSGCSAAPDAVAGAVIMSAVAATASGISRATGGCYAGCPPGTTCNNVTGFCEVLPCRGLCNEDQDCDESGAIPKCVARKADITIETEKQRGVEEPDQSPP